MSYGKLYGVGVGPGASDLMTLRAVNTLKSVDVIAIPRRSQWDESVAWRIAKENVGKIEGQERLFLTFPMTKDPERLAPAWAEAFEQIGERLARKLNVAFITQGDPLLYSTFVYLKEAAPESWPGIEIEVVPAVCSMTAVASVTGTAVADGQERVAVLPATYGTEDLVQMLRDFDTVVLMKVGSVMPQVVEAVQRVGLLDRAVYVSNATMTRQKVVRDITTIRNDKCDYFSMVIVSRKDRSGVLKGEVARAQRGEANPQEVPS